MNLKEFSPLYKLLQPTTMRPIKFRAWSKKDKCWCGAFSIHKSGLFSEMINASLVNGQCVADAHWENLDEEQTIVLMQFTGLLDKNGKEIFEGDLVKWLGDDRISEVRWSDKELGFRVSELEGYENPLFVLRAFGCEVVGNIYENPELLNPPQGK